MFLHVQTSCPVWPSVASGLLAILQWLRPESQKSCETDGLYQKLKNVSTRASRGLNSSFQKTITDNHENIFNHQSLVQRPLSVPRTNRHLSFLMSYMMNTFLPTCSESHGRIRNIPAGFYSHVKMCQRSASGYRRVICIATQLPDMDEVLLCAVPVLFTHSLQCDLLCDATQNLLLPYKHSGQKKTHTHFFNLGFQRLTSVFRLKPFQLSLQLCFI